MNEAQRLATGLRSDVCGALRAADAPFTNTLGLKMLPIAPGAFTMGENIAAGNGTAAATVQQWMDSDGHCANIMNKNYRFLGVGYYYDAAAKYIAADFEGPNPDAAFHDITVDGKLTTASDACRTSTRNTINT